MGWTKNATLHLSDQMQVMAERMVARIVAFRCASKSGTLSTYCEHYNIAYFLWDGDHIYTNMI